VVLAYNIPNKLGEIMNKYFQTLNQIPIHPIITKMRDIAYRQQVPIINDEGLVFLLFLVKTIKAKRILEIGTAIGFSAIHMALVDEAIHVETIERDPVLVEQAITHIREANLTSQITLIHEDALLLEVQQLKGNYDIIFIDAAKAQYQKFFTKYAPLLATSGIIVSDNLLFHGLVTGEKEIESKNLRHLVEKIDAFNKWLAKNPDYDTTFFAIGDGMAVSTRCKR